MEKYTVILVDDHQLFREGLKMLLENMALIRHVDEAPDGAAFFKLLEKGLPDVVFMDIEIPGKDGITLTQEALERYPELKIIALSMYGDENYYTRMISAGARGFILKNSGIQDVEEAIRYVVSGNNYFSPEILNRLIRGFRNNRRTVASTELTEREQEVLYHICKGLSNQEIADTLFLSKRTVDKHRENLLSKTGSKNTAGMVMYAVKHHIVSV